MTDSELDPKKRILQATMELLSEQEPETITVRQIAERAQVGVDIFTSVFFFIFSLALIGTSWRFFTDSLSMLEVTEETWRVQYYPVKAMMVIGAVCGFAAAALTGSPWIGILAAIVAGALLSLLFAVLTLLTHAEDG